MNLKDSCIEAIESYFKYCLRTYLGSEFCERFECTGISTHETLSDDCREQIFMFVNEVENLLISDLEMPMNYIDEVSFVVDASYLGSDEQPTVSLIIRKYHYEEDKDDEYRYLIYESLLETKDCTHHPKMSILFTPSKRKDMNKLATVFDYISSELKNS